MKMTEIKFRCTLKNNVLKRGEDGYIYMNLNLREFI